MRVMREKFKVYTNVKVKRSGHCEPLGKVNKKGVEVNNNIL